MIWGKPSTRVQELIRAGLQLVSESGDEWIADITHATAQSVPQVAADPDLAAAVSRAHRATLRCWGSAMMQSPTAPAAPLLDTAENLALARTLTRHGLDALTPDIFRIAQTVAWRRWTDIAFGLGADPVELREVLNLSMSRLSEFLDAACRYVCAPTQANSRHADIEHQRNLKRRALIESLLYGTATDTDTAVVAGLLGYRLDLPHTAAVIWSDRGDDDAAALDHAARALIEACGGQSLSVTSGAQSHWVWAHQVQCVDPGQIEAAIAPQVYMAIGSPARGIRGFVRSHRDALAAQRIMAELKCPQRVLHSSTQLQLIGLVAKNRAEANDFIQSTLGDLAFASPSIHASVLAYIEAGCNVTWL